MSIGEKKRPCRSLLRLVLVLRAVPAEGIQEERERSFRFVHVVHVLAESRTLDGTVSDPCVLLSSGSSPEHAI